MQAFAFGVLDHRSKSSMYAPVYATYAAGLAAAGMGLALSRGRSSQRWAGEIGEQLAERIRSDEPAIRSAAIEQAYYVATSHRDVDLSSTVPALLDVYRADPAPRYRLASVATLHAIGNDAGMRGLSDHLPDQTDRYVQIISIAALRDHYGTDSYFDSDDVAQMSRAVLEGLNPPTKPPA